MLSHSTNLEEVKMKIDFFTKVILSAIAVLLLLNLLSGFFASRTAFAQKEENQKGRYEISAWASPIGTYGHHSCYYIIDTTTGKVTDSHEDIHTITQPEKQ
jgi:hypothetical protein